MRRVLPLKIALVSLVIGACVTINVYFPAAAADKAADQYWSGVAGGTNKDNAPPAPTPPQGNLAPAHDEQNLVLVAMGEVLNVLVPAAHAQDADINVNTPAVNRIGASMRGRLGELKKFFASGAVGLNKDGMLEIRDQNAVALPDRATAKRLVAEDNADRAQLYAELANANNHPELEGKLRDAWSASFVRTVMEPGWYYQDAGGAWKQK